MALLNRFGDELLCENFEFLCALYSKGVYYSQQPTFFDHKTNERISHDSFPLDNVLDDDHIRQGLHVNYCSSSKKKGIRPPTEVYQRLLLTRVDSASAQYDFLLLMKR